tara:strand:- start:1835 stop:2476 length:642 start_codon:yes stop_codon:yes gene_type:complete
MALWFVKNKVVYLAPQKTATTSIEKFLSDELGYSPLGHRHTILSDDEIKYMKENNFFSFGFVRNPWDRIVSMYKWEEQVKNEPAMKSGALPFEKYCEYIYKAYHGIESFDLIEGFVCNSIYRHMHHEKEKGHFISHYNKMYRNGEQIFDFIGKYENLAEDMQIVCDQIGIINKPLPMINKTNHSGYREYYSDESRQRIAEVYLEDIDAFGYEF